MPAGGRPRRLRLVVVALLLPVVLPVAGCASQDSSGLPQFSPSAVVPSDPGTPATPGPSGTSPVPSTTAPAGPGGVRTAAPVDVLGTSTGVQVGAVAPGVEPELVQAWYDYMRVRLEALSSRELDVDALGAVAVGFATTDLVSEVERRVSDGTRDVGMVSLDVRGARVDGATAELYDCLGVQAGLVDDAGVPLEAPLGATPLRVTLQQTPDGWVVSSYSAEERCRDAPGA